MHEFRFSHNIFGIASRERLIERCRRSENAGYDAVYAADHLGTASPFPLLVAVAAATERLRVGTLVLNVGFWNPALLAREVATADVLTDGRLELGLGAGHMKWEFDEAGIAWSPYDDRVDRLAATVDALHQQFRREGYPEQAALHEEFGMPVLRPLQRIGFDGAGPPLLVGGTGERVLDLAARKADTVGVAGAVQLPGRPPGTFRIATAAETDARVRVARDRTAGRAAEPEWQILVQAVVVTDDRASAAAELARRFGGIMAADELLDTPFVLLGTVEEIAGQVRAHRERFGFTHYTVHAPFADAFAPVIRHLRGRER